MAATLPLLGPHSRVPGLGPSFDTEVGQGGDEDLLQPANVWDYLFGVLEGEDWVADQLPGTVESDVSSPIDVMHLGLDHRPVDKEVVGVTIAPDGENRWVLQQEQIVVVGATPGLSLVKGPLQVPRLRVGKTTQPA